MQKFIDYLKQRSLENNLPRSSRRGIPPFIRKRIKMASKDGLLELQLLKFKNTIHYMNQYIPFYHRQFKDKGVLPSDISSLEDISQLPITYREDLEANTLDFISTYPGLIPSIQISTSGTSGKAINLYLTNAELQYYAAGDAIMGLISGTLGPREITQIHMPVDVSSTALIGTSAARLSDTLALTFGTLGNLDEHLDSIFQERHIPGRKPKVTSLGLSPNHLWALTNRGIERGVDFGQSHVKHIGAGGTMVSETLKKLVKDTWGVKVTELYGLVEAPTCSAGECPHGRMHMLDWTAYTEVLDPQTKRPVPPGTPGVLVTTTFYPDRELMPVLRYWTNDLVIATPEYECDCGMISMQLMDILGRTDQMIQLAGRNYYPQEIGDSLLGFDELVSPPRFRVTTEDRRDAQYGIVEVELAKPISSEQEKTLIKHIKQQIVFKYLFFVDMEVVKIEIKLVPRNSLRNPFPYKSQGYLPKR
jgi:phenylacetate-CoA ligase